MAAVQTLQLNSGFEMPTLGIGTGSWMTSKEKAEAVVEAAVKAAIDCGYRHIDCAFIYQTEREVGSALQAKFQDCTVSRDQLFVSTKLWNTFHRADLVTEGLRESLTALQLEYVDLLLMHWPLAFKEDGELFPMDKSGKMQYSDVDFLETWKAMEKEVDAGRTKSIGLSNFNLKQVQKILDIPDLMHKPAVLQVEIHPYMANTKLVEFCKSKDIVVTAYSPLGSPNRPWAKIDDPNLLEEEVVVKIGQKYNKTPAQVLLRWGIDRGCAVIPRSITPARIEENFQLPLSSACYMSFSGDDVDPTYFHGNEMDVINSFNRDCRAIQFPMFEDHPHYPFKEEL